MEEGTEICRGWWYPTARSFRLLSRYVTIDLVVFVTPIEYHRKKTNREKRDK